MGLRERFQIFGFENHLCPFPQRKNLYADPTLLLDGQPIPVKGFVRSLFGYNRLVTLLACLRFDDKGTRSTRKDKDPLAPIREVWDLFERSLKRHYSPGSFLTVDEQLVPFRGRCKFRMYIPSLTCVGTVRKDKKFIPEPLRHHSFSKDKQYTSRFAFQEKATMVSYKSKKNKVVTLLSTMHSDKAVSEDEKKKPDIVAFYNSTKGGVDGMDQKVHKYSCKRKSHRWPMAYFFNIVDVACLAAHVVFKTKFPDHPLSGKDSRSHFIRSVASGLAQAQLFRRQEIPTLSLYLKETISISIASLDQNKSTRQTRKGLPQPSTPQSKSKAGSKSSTPQEKKMSTSQSATPLAKPQKIKKQQQRCRNCPWKKG
ncbi:PiggyBac transposable element-derived protein 4 [Plakobranchus ocellatus]|uniref:PiggyBac transposable element-derived protein 4 n=1 Tax=Plakobranchus ocellatus TaxID=259542 RepID=A0AAV4CJ34_9GAST|nr:PiggyBac transposable element-derived protein 4 [Plakobranchus ocellatus]